MGWTIPLLPLITERCHNGIGMVHGWYHTVSMSVRGKKQKKTYPSYKNIRGQKTTKTFPSKKCVRGKKIGLILNLLTIT
jgi:hypothetical protein